tara:strand:- start:727 stop:1017 length:291 start_codon:yes stop_codon:yes gene_type:complete
MVSGLVKLQAKEDARSSTKKSIKKHGPWFVVARDFVRDTKGHLGYYVYPANDVTNLLWQSMTDKREGRESTLPHLWSGVLRHDECELLKGSANMYP